MEYIVFGGTIMMFLNILDNVVLIVFVVACVFFTSGTFINIITMLKTGVKNIDELLYKLKIIKIYKIFILLTIICIYIEIVLLLACVLAAVLIK